MTIAKLPVGWHKTSLGEILELKYGKSLPAKARDGEKYPVYGSNGSVGKHSKPLVESPGIIVGRKGSFGVVHLSEGPFSPIDTTYFVDQLYSQPIKYWFYQLTALPLTQLNRSTAIPGLNREDAYNQEITIPPLAEQKQIAAQLDQLLAKVDRIKARLDALPVILKRFRQSVLAAAVSGKLTNKNRVEDTRYYGQIEAEIASEKKLKKLKPLSEEEVALSNSLHGETHWGNWKLYPLEQLVDAERGIPYGIVQTGEHTDDGVPTVRCGDVKPLKILQSELKQVAKEIDAKYQRTSLQGGEVLLAIRGTVGNAAVVPMEMRSSNISREIAMVPVRDSVNPHFIALLLQSPTGYRCLAEKVKGVAQKGINLADVKRFVTPLPPISEQTEIVHQVDRLFAFADQVEQQVQNAQARVNKLTQSILAKAFRGELTAQWRADNPELISGANRAESLLEKIQAERADLKNKPKEKRTRAKKAGSTMSKQVIKIAAALEQAGEPLSGQQLLVAAGYPSDSNTEELESFFLDLRDTLLLEKSIVKLTRSDDGQDWFELVKAEKKAKLD